jgi:hypothetical protein
MNSRILFLLFAVTVCLPVASAQDDAVAEAISGLKEAQKQKIPGDQKHFIAKTVEKWEDADDKQKKEILDLAKKNLRTKEADVKLETVRALALMKGGDRERWSDTASKILIDEQKQKSTEDDLTYHMEVVKALGQIAHKRGIPVLTKLLRYKDYDVVGASAAALGYYKAEDTAAKKDIVKEILKLYSTMEVQAQDVRDPIARERLAKVAPRAEEALRALTGKADISGAENWQSWWNNEGKKAKDWSS